MVYWEEPWELTREMAWGRKREDGKLPGEVPPLGNQAPGSFLNAWELRVCHTLTLMPATGRFAAGWGTMVPLLLLSVTLADWLEPREVNASKHTPLQQETAPE